VVATGGLTTFEQAEAILQRGQADIAGLARQALADPDGHKGETWPRRGSPALHLYNYCEALGSGASPRNVQTLGPQWNWTSPESPRSDEGGDDY